VGVGSVSNLATKPSAEIREDDRIGFTELMGYLAGGVTVEEAEFLRQLAAQVQSGCIVEIGSFRGKSAIALAMGVRQQDRMRQPAIYCVEPHRPFTGFYGGEFGPKDRGVFYQEMCRTGAFNEVALVNLPSDVAASSWREPVGLCFIDGDHRYAGVKQDFECWDPHVLPGGLVAFDDAIDPECGPHRLIDEILRTQRYRRIAGVGKVVVLKKSHVMTEPPRQLPTRRQHLLIACHDLVLTGGLLRFERMGTILRNWGHEVALVAMGDTVAPEFASKVAIMSLP